MPDFQAQIVASTIRHAVDVLRLAADQRLRILGLLKRLEGDLVAQLEDADPSGVTRTDFRRRRLEALIAQTRDTIRRAYADARDLQAEDLRELATFASEVAAGQLAPVLTAVGAEAVALSAEQLAAIASGTLVRGAPSAEWWSRQAGDVVRRFADEMRMGLLAGETNQQLVQRLRGKATGRRVEVVIDGRRRRVREFLGGVLGITTRNAESLVRTSVQAVAAQARRDSFRANGDIVKGLVQISTLDTRTTEICIAYSGAAWEFGSGGEMVPVGHSLPFDGGPPRHWRCRSTTAPWLRSWRDLGIPLRDVPTGTRASLHGQLPADISFDDFLRTLSPEQVDEMLGAGKADLWRRGEISLRELVDQDGNPVTLQDLRGG